MSSPAPMSAYTRQNPFPAKITENYCLTREGSGKETRHIVVNIGGSGLQYEVGASLAVYAQNPPEVVDQLIKLLKFDPAAPAGEGAAAVPLRDALLKGYTINRASKKFVAGVAARLTGPDKEKLDAIVADDAKAGEYIYDRDVVDVLLEYPSAGFAAPAEFLALLNKSPAPRLYSIASSQAVYPDEVHLTVAVVDYVTHGREKVGFASGWLGHYAKPGTTAPVFVQPSKHFHLPPSGDVDIIMVGPGTGIAPFRAFLQQRDYDKAKGKNWLFFGERQKATDYLYETDFAEFQKKGVLTRIDTAFSRDQANKIYVQDRMRENAAELWNWIKAGAYFYVCGDAKRMAKDVHAALIEIAQKNGGMTLEAATEFVETTLMKTEKRYLRDVY